jgi:hypothetical protein
MGGGGDGGGEASSNPKVVRKIPDRMEEFMGL